jgi:hypothetical protein
VITHIVNITPDLPSELIEERVFSQFPGWTWSQRSRPTNSWIWNEGYDIQQESIYLWVCKACVKLNRPQIASFNAAGLQNPREHLWRDHNIAAPEGEKKSVAQSQDENLSQPSITAHFKLNSVQPREQQIVNSIIRSFDKQHL